MKINKISILFDELNYAQLKEYSKFIKPSNFKNFLNNKIKKAKLISEIELFLDKNGSRNYIIKGEVSDLRADLLKDVILSDTIWIFRRQRRYFNKKLIWQNRWCEINNGDIKLNLENGVKLSSNFISNINLKENNIKKFNEILSNLKLAGNIKELEGNFNNNILVNLDKTYKVTNYNYNFSGKVKIVKLNYIKL